MVEFEEFGKGRIHKFSSDGLNMFSMEPQGMECWTVGVATTSDFSSLPHATTERHRYDAKLELSCCDDVRSEEVADFAEENVAEDELDVLIQKQMRVSRQLAEQEETSSQMIETMVKLHNEAKQYKREVEELKRRLTSINDQ